MGKTTSTGITIAVVEGRPATLDEAGFAALVYVPIGQLTNIPAFGPTISVVESKPLATGITEKYVGFINNGSTTLDADFDDEDAGQALVTNAVTFSHASFGKEFSFKLTYQSGAVRYWIGRFFSATESPNGADSMVTTSMQVEINTDILKVAAP